MWQQSKKGIKRHTQEEEPIQQPTENTSGAEEAEQESKQTDTDKELTTTYCTRETRNAPTATNTNTNGNPALAAQDHET
jgi:hypothetical protein